MSQQNLHRKFSPNIQGCDYFVGDVHGHVEWLMKALHQVSFNFKNDRLFCAGDLVNKGPDSVGAIELLCEPWFYSVAGNHDKAFVALARGEIPLSSFVELGGDWAQRLSAQSIDELADIIELRTSLALTVQSKQGSIGVVHGSSPASWDTFVAELSASEIDTLWRYCTWSFAQSVKARQEHLPLVQGVDWVVSGHIASKEPLLSSNHIWIDTLHVSGSFTILSAEQIFSIPRIDPSAQDDSFKL